MPGWLTNGMPLIAAGTTYPNLGGREEFPADSQLSTGSAPQTLAATAFNIAALAAELVHNTASATAGAATLNTLSGLITSEALTTAANGTYTLTLTNSTVTAAKTPQVFVFNGSNTTTGSYVSAVTPSSGSLSVVVTNGGTAALNGTILIAFRV
jgi:hypothetical protein